MSWDNIFTLANVWAMMCWLALLLFPRTDFLKRAILYGGTGLLCIAYGSALGLLWSGAVDAGGPGGGDFGSIAGVRALFMSDAGIVIGWMHYLAFDLFAGLWIAQDADARGVNRLVQAPVLALTFLFGPIGMLIWLVVRALRAEKQQPASS